MHILVINPGSTSTKIAVYQDATPIMLRTIRHTVEELAQFDEVTDQYDFRRKLVIDELKRMDIDYVFEAVIGRGGLAKPVSGGVYEINEKMLDDTRQAIHKHACDLGCIMAYEIARMIPGCRAFIADPGVVDELSPLARICHMGCGISIAAHEKGRAIDANNALDGEGPFSPERAGSLPAADLIRLCFSGQFTEKELLKRIAGQAGLIAHLGTNDMKEIESRIARGDKHAELVVDAMIYQVAKNIASEGSVLCGKIDAILLTGGLVRSDYLVSRLRERISFLAPIHCYPGEDEMQALALNALDVLHHRREAKVYE